MDVGLFLSRSGSKTVNFILSSQMNGIRFPGQRVSRNLLRIYTFHPHLL